MAGSINKVILVGNLGRDPEIRHTNSGQKIANLSVATSDTWKDKNARQALERTRVLHLRGSRGRRSQERPCIEGCDGRVEPQSSQARYRVLTE